MVLEAIAINPNEKSTEVGSLLAIARSETCKREPTSINPLVRASVFVHHVGGYSAVRQVLDSSESSNRKLGSR